MESSRRLNLALRHPSLIGTTSVVKFVHGSGRGWRRTPLGGGGGSHFHLWWAPFGTPPVAHLGSLRPGDVVVRALRHHDETDDALEGDRRPRVGRSRAEQPVAPATGWETCHAWIFDVGERAFGNEGESPRRTKLRDLGLVEGASFLYHNDFGDGCEHTIKQEKIVPGTPDVQYAVCLAAKRACPPEDCGGVHRYDDLISHLPELLATDPDDVAERLGEDFDPEYVDVGEISACLKRKPPKRKPRSE